MVIFVRQAPRRSIRNFRSEPIEGQRRTVHERRQSLIRGETTVSLWQQEMPETHQLLVDRHGAEAIHRAELLITLFHTDRLWSAHLSFVADLREGNRLVGFTDEDPLTRFRVETAEAYYQIEHDLADAILAAGETSAVSPAQIQ